MKSLLIVFLIATAIAGSALAQREVPNVVAEGLNAYQNAGAKAATDTWVKGSLMENDAATKATIEAQLSRFQTDYGKIIGFDLLRRVVLSPSFERLYILIKFEKGPVYASFDCYRASAGWIVSQLNLSTKASDILPPGLLSGSRQ